MWKFSLRFEASVLLNEFVIELVAVGVPPFLGLVVGIEILRDEKSDC